MKRTLSWNEILVTGLVKVSGYSAIVFVGMILYFLLRESLPSFREVPLSVIFSDRWYPIEDYFGILPLLGGSLIVTLGAMIIAVPVGITTAIYISEIGPRWAREFLKPLIELLAGLPSVVLGFLGVVVFTSLFAALSISRPVSRLSPALYSSAGLLSRLSSPSPKMLLTPFPVPTGMER